MRKALFYATAVTLGGVANGNPGGKQYGPALRKVEGNLGDHPASLARERRFLPRPPYSVFTIRIVHKRKSTMGASGVGLHSRIIFQLLWERKKAEAARACVCSPLTITSPSLGEQIRNFLKRVTHPRNGSHK